MPDLSEARDQTCILVRTSWIHFHCAATGTPLKKKKTDFIVGVCESSLARDQTHATVIQATAVTMPDPQPTEPQGNSERFLSIIIPWLFYSGVIFKY